MGTTSSGLRYPEPTDPVSQGAAAIKNLATDITTKYTTVGYPARPLGTLSNMGTYDNTVAPHHVAGYSITTTDGTGQLTVTLPAGLKCIVAAWATPFVQSGTEMVTVQWVLRVEQSTLGGLRWMARNTVDGTVYANARMGIMWGMICQ